MITKEDLRKFLDLYSKFDRSVIRMGEAILGKPYSYSADLFETDWYETVNEMFYTFIESHFTEIGCDSIFWWMFEDVDHIITQTVDPDLFNGKSEIEYNVNDIEDLWKYLIKYKKDYFLNE